MYFKFKNIVKVLVLMQLVIACTFALTNIPVFAQTTPAIPSTNTKPAATTAQPASNPKDTVEVPTSGPGNGVLKLNDCPGQETTLTITSLLKPTSFVPLIPDACSGGTDAPQALSLKAIPIIIVRIYGLLASLVFFLTGFNLIFASVRYSYGAFQESEAKNAINSIQESATSVALVMVAHLIVSTIFSTVFQIPLNTDATYIQSFFN